MRLLKWNYVEGTATAKETATADCSNTREDVHTVTGKGDRHSVVSQGGGNSPEAFCTQSLKRGRKQTRANCDR